MWFTIGIAHRVNRRTLRRNQVATLTLSTIL
jgi:hypothetical protein